MNAVCRRIPQRTPRIAVAPRHAAPLHAAPRHTAQRHSVHPVLAHSLYPRLTYARLNLHVSIPLSSPPNQLTPASHESDVPARSSLRSSMVAGQIPPGRSTASPPDMIPVSTGRSKVRERCPISQSAPAPTRKRGQRLKELCERSARLTGVSSRPS